ncbi:MAG: GNAT family N-acetyltransferase [Anaerolineae bacterium]
MQLTIREADPLHDYETVAALLSTESLFPITAAHITDWDRNRPQGQIRRRAVGINADGVILGYSLALHHPGGTPGMWTIHVHIARDARHQGYGRQLYDDAIAFAQARGGSAFTGEVSEMQPEGRAFAERRGFHLHRHQFSSKLDLTTFDEAGFRDVIPRLEAEGIRFSSLSAEGSTPDAQRNLYELNRETDNDNPSNSGSSSFPSFDVFQQQVLNASWFEPPGQLLAIDGDRWVGLGAVSLEPDPPSAYCAFTGVRASHRKRGIALALKLLGIRYAREHGARTISTDNDSENAPMLHINRKLGFQSQPGTWILIKRGEA